MSEQLLHRTNIPAHFEEMCREGVSQRMTGRALAPFQIAYACRHSALDCGLMDVVTSNSTAPRAARQPRRREHELPAEFVIGLRKLDGERRRQLDASEAARQILLVQRAPPFQL